MTSIIFSDDEEEEFFTSDDEEEEEFFTSYDEEETEFFTSDDEEYDNESYYTAVDLVKKEAEDIQLLDEILTCLKTLFKTEKREEDPESKEEVPEHKEEKTEPQAALVEHQIPLPDDEPVKVTEDPFGSPFEPFPYPQAGSPGIGKPSAIPGPEENFKITSQYYDSYLEDVKILGRGTFAEARLQRDIKRNSLVVDKVLFCDNASRVTQEVTCLERLSGNQHFVTYLGHFVNEEEDNIHIFMDYFDGRPLMNLLHQKFLALEEVQILLAKLGDAMRYMHSKSIIHMDIKPDNILVNQQLDIKIIDFNVSRTNGPQDKGYAGSVPFIAPEIVANKDKKKGGSHYGYEADYYSLGIATFFMGVNHFPTSLQKKLLEETKKRLIPFVASLQQHIAPDGPDDDFHDLILGLLHQDPAERLNDETFLEHPFFKKTFQLPWPLPEPEELLRVVKALKKKRWYKKGPGCTKKSEQFQHFMEEKEPACNMAGIRLAFVGQKLEKTLLPPQKKKKQTKWDKVKAAFKPKKKYQENSPKPPAKEKKDETSGRKKSSFPWIPKVFRKKQYDQEKSKPVLDHEDEMLVEDGKPKKKTFFKSFFKKKDKRS